ncbi:MerR family DNA-binding transcriptional regulator [Solwaraspora sp. WMMB762]|uniref:MerR family DNA-binding transcriptional regulator n=1 Tax=Solwaraspora sp. WMMB762 TaxID=3404120 RepID=UPI003B941D42
MWRIGEVARMVGVSERTLRHYDKVGLPLRRIADLLDAPDAQLRQALVETVAALRDDIAARTATVVAAEDHLAGTASVLPQVARVGARRLRVRHVRVADPAELAALCRQQPPTVLLTWLRGRPGTGFRAAVTTDGPGERLDLPARTVVRAVVPPTTGVVRAGLDLFAWLPRQYLTVAGPTTEDHLVDGDGAAVTVLEIPVAARPDRPTLPHQHARPAR